MVDGFSPSWIGLLVTIKYEYIQMIVTGQHSLHLKVSMNTRSFRLDLQMHQLHSCVSRIKSSIHIDDMQ